MVVAVGGWAGRATARTSEAGGGGGAGGGTRESPFLLLLRRRSHGLNWFGVEAVDHGTGHLLAAVGAVAGRYQETEEKRARRFNSLQKRKSK
jgi:uncharacterized spore protein YtfJ